jgi:hypothetical protein
MSGDKNFGAVIQRAPVAPVTVNPLITPTSAVVVVGKSHTTPARMKITLSVSSHFKRSGTLSRTSTATSGDIHIFTLAVGGKEIDFVGNTNTTFSGAQLSSPGGVPLFAEARQPSFSMDDFVLTFTLLKGATPVGPDATATLTAVQLSLDIAGPRPSPITPAPLMPQPPPTPPAPGTAVDKWFLGRTLNVQDAASGQEERVKIHISAVSPIAFAGDLILRQVQVNASNAINGLAKRVQLFDKEIPGAQQIPPVVDTAEANPLVFNASTAASVIGRDFFVEGSTPSTAVRDTGYQLGIDKVENDGDRVSMTVAVAPLITVDSPFVVVKKPHTNPKRRVVTLKTSGPFTGKGTLSKSGAGPIKIFPTVASTKEIAFNGTDNVFTGALLSSASGVAVFAESSTASGSVEDFQLTLTLTGSGTLPVGQAVAVKLTAVELTLDIAQTRSSANIVPPLLSSTEKITQGAFVIVQDAAFSHERARLHINRPSPGVTVTLRLEAISASVQAFIREDARAGQTAAVTSAAPLTILSVVLPAGGTEFFVEGAALASTTLRDTGFRLGIDAVENDADHVNITVFPDPSLPGPFAVGEHEYTRVAKLAIGTITETLSDLTLADGVAPPAAQTTPAFSAKIHALVRYPATTGGADKPVSGVQPTYPLVVIAHGNHRVLNKTNVPVESFRGLEYLARHLASYGYIAISVDLDVVNTDPVLGFIFPGIVQRGLVILEHIAFWGVLNGSDPLFKGKVDLTQIALIGHSRGGEAVVSAQKSNVGDGRGFNIKAMVSISQTDFLGITHSTTPYLIIYGSADGDVSLGWPFRMYDRASLFKTLVFVYGAIHNRFSTNFDWLLEGVGPDSQIDSTDPRRISADDHLNIARGCCLGFLQLTLHGIGDHAALFKNNARLSAVTSSVEIHNQVREVPPRLTVDDFGQGAFNPAAPQGPQLAARATTNTLSNAVTQTGLVTPAGPFTNALTEASLRHRELNLAGSNDFFWNDTFGEMLAWDAVGATYTQPLGTQDVSSLLVLSFRVTQRLGSARNPNPPGDTPGNSPDFSIELTDSAGAKAVVRVGSISLVPFPWKRLNSAGGLSALSKSALTTIRIPLTAFTAVNAALSLKVLTGVAFKFTTTAKGEIAITDLEFSN